MIVYYVRHTTPDIDKGVCYGQADIDVAANFNDEADFLIQKLQNVNIETVLSSPLKRCTKLAAKLNSEYTIVNELMELNFGDWELKQWNNISEEETAPWMNDFVTVAVPNGESYLDLFARAIKVYKNIKKDNTIVVTHSGIIRSVLSHITNTNLNDSFDFKIPYGTIVRIDTITNEYTIL